MALSSIQVPSGVTLLGLSLSSFSKTVTLPVIASNPGRMLIFKDMFGYANNSTIRVSSSQQDIIERSNASSIILSTNYGAWTFLNDGINKWFITSAYLNNLTINGNLNTYVTSNLVYFLDAGNPLSYPGSGTTWSNIVAPGCNMTLYNSPAYSSANGGYLTFTPASSQYAECLTSLPYMSNFTLEVWHYYTGFSGTNPAIVTENYPGTTSRIAYSLANPTSSMPNVQVAFFTGSWQASASWTPTANIWYQIVGTYDGANLRLYVNNSNVATTPNTTVVQSNTGGFRLMRRWDTTDYWGGRLAIYRVYNRALTAAEVSSNFSGSRNRFGI